MIDVCRRRGSIGSGHTLCLLDMRVDLRKLFFLFTILLSSASVFATTFRMLQPEEVRKGADSVVLASVQKIEYHQYETHPWTILTLKVERSFKKGSPSVIQVRIPGGIQSINGRMLVTKIDGVPEIRLQERGIFFLESHPPSFAGLFGWEQGYYRIVKKEGQEFVVRSDGAETKKLEDFIRNLSEKSQAGVKQ